MPRICPLSRKSRATARLGGQLELKKHRVKNCQLSV